MYRGNTFFSQKTVVEKLKLNFRTVLEKTFLTFPQAHYFFSSNIINIFNFNPEERQEVLEIWLVLQSNFCLLVHMPSDSKPV